MNREDKIMLIKGLLETVEESVIAKVDVMPEEWDGRELRQVIADKAAQLVWDAYKLKGKEKKEFYNFLYENNII